VSLAVAGVTTLIGSFAFQLLLQTGAVLGWMRRHLEGTVTLREADTATNRISHIRHT
jgi:hypothetical protein